MSRANSDRPIAAMRKYGVLSASNGSAMGFMGLARAKIDALFLAPECHRRGWGQRLVDHARALRGQLTVDVNEQNVEAVTFYQACGFVVGGRSDVDEMGRPCPLLHMRGDALDERTDRDVP